MLGDHAIDPGAGRDELPLPSLIGIHRCVATVRTSDRLPWRRRTTRWARVAPFPAEQDNPQVGWQIVKGLGHVHPELAVTTAS